MNKPTLQLNESDPKQCTTLWKQAFDLRNKYNYIIKLEDIEPWVNGVWNSNSVSFIIPTELHQSDSELCHFTSGTTGKPKLISRTWDSLLNGININPEFENKTWACSYPVDKMAGIQVVLFCMQNKTTPILTNTPQMLAQNIDKCIGASATSAMWKFALALGCNSLYCKQITIGGDGVDQNTLNQLRIAFPNARITQTYASTEAGFICSWSDGLVGIPIEKFNRKASIAIDGEIILTENLNATGDIAKIDNGRVLILGRKDNIVNVGGWKINLEIIEQIIKNNTTIEDCQAKGVQNSVLGQSLVLHVKCSNMEQFHKEFNSIQWENRAMRPLKIIQVQQILRDKQGKIKRCE